MMEFSFRPTIAINNQMVTKIGKLGNVDIYQPEQDTDEAVLYLVQGGEVIGKIEVSCGMSQGCGFVDSIEITEA